jgi:hypothetical protein
MEQGRGQQGEGLNGEDGKDLSLLDDGGGKLATVAGRGQVKVGKDNRESGWNEKEGNRGRDWNGEDSKDLSLFNPKCNKTPPCIDSYSGVVAAGTLLETPPLTRQLFLKESDLAAVGVILPERENSWSLMTSDAAPHARSDGLPSLQPQGTPNKALSKQGKVITHLAAAERDSAAANAHMNALWFVPAPTEEELPPSNLSCPQASVCPSNKALDSNAASNTPGSNKSLGSRGAGALLSDMAALRHDKQQSRLTSPISDGTPISEGTPSLLTESSVSAITISTLAHSSLNASKYSSVPHGYLPVNDSAVVENRDMFSMDHRIPLGVSGHFWFLMLGIDYVKGEDSWGTMLIGMSSIMETFPQKIDEFELHPLDPASSLPFLTSNQVDKGFPQSAIMMFRYFHVKNKMNSKGAPQPAGETTAASPNRYNYDADFKPSSTLWGTARVLAKENIKEAVESLSWDFNNTGIQVWWKPHQSADSSAQVQIFCCPSVFEREGLTKELTYNLNMVEKKMYNKGQLPMDLHDKPLPSMYISWTQNSQGRG